MKRYPDRERAVSEEIGAILLVSLVVMLVTIVGVYILSQPPPQKIPVLKVTIWNDSQNVYLRHAGGDPLLFNDTRIFVNGNDVTSDMYLSTEHGQSWHSWSIGKVLVYPLGSAAFSNALVAYTGSGAESVLLLYNPYDSTIGSGAPTPTMAVSHTIIASAGSGGTISPSGSVSVADGGSQLFTLSPAAGYSVANVIVDGTSQGQVLTYLFTNVGSDHTISATFTPTTHTITSSNTTGGSITPYGSIQVTEGGSQTYLITPDAGKTITDVTVDGLSIGVVSSYTFTNVTASHTIIASFATLFHTVTASAGTGGSIAPLGSVSVADGASQAFTITPNTGYHAVNVLVDSAPNGALASYTFTNVTADHTIAASFAINTYNITSSASPGGSISPAGVTTVTYGANQTYTITPNAGQSITAVMVDGVSVGAVASYTFTNVTASHTIAASFVTVKYTITASAGTGGNITPYGSVQVYYGTDQAFTITNTSGYYISGVVVDGVSQGMISTYTFHNVTSAHTIAASFATNPVITASAGSGGSISPSGSVSVVYGTSQTFSITPNTGYHVTDVLVDGVSQGTITSYTFTNVITGHTIAASFAINTYVITPSAGTGGSISPSGPVTVNYGASQIFSISPTTGYSISDVLVDGVSVGAVSSYTFTNVQASHTITAAFSTLSYTITASAGSGGTISPSGAVSVSYGGSQSFSITPNTGYHISDVVVDGASQGAISSYTFTSVQASHTIAASFAINTYTISPSAGAGGSISPSSPVTVNYGGSQTFSISPTTGYSISNVLVDGVSVGAVSSYTFTNVQASHTIAASFAINTFTITASAGTGGSISPSGSVIVNYGSSQTFTIAANSGYSISSVVVDGVSQGAISSYTFTNVQASHTITVSFVAASWGITESWSPGGLGIISISPPTALANPQTVNVPIGGSQTFYFIPNVNKQVLSYAVDGGAPVNPGAGKDVTVTYTFTNVQAAHTLAVTFG